MCRLSINQYELTLKELRGSIRVSAVILALLSVVFNVDAQESGTAWAGDNPQERAGGCSFFDLTPDPSPPTCNGFEDGVASVIPSGGVGPYTYNWIGGPTTQTWNNVGAGTYTVIVFDQGQGGLPCNIDVFVNEPGPLTVFEMNGVAPTCFGACNGQAAPIVIGGNGGYTLTWSSGETGFTADELCNPFTLTVTDAQGCVLDSTYTFDDEPEEIIITADSTNVSCFGASDGAIDITVTGGSPEYTFAWTGPGGFSSVSQGINGLIAGSYTVVVTDVNGCEAEATFTLSEPDELLINATLTPNACAGDTLGAIDLTVTGGTPDYSYTWSGPGGFSSVAPDLINLISGTYSVEVTDANNCIAMAEFTISEPPPIVIELNPEDISCAGANDGVIDATVSGGSGTLTFGWAGPGGFTSSDEDLTGLAPGIYTLTVTDTAGCVAEATLELTEPEPIVIDGVVTDISCNAAADGTITISVSGGTPDYTYAWIGPDGFTSGDQDLTGLAVGDYLVTVTDANGCEQSATFTIAEPAPINLSADITDNLCAGQSTGAIDLSVTGGTAPYTFSWTGPAGFTADTEDISGLVQGAYAVEVTDTNGCAQAVAFTVSESDPIVLDLNASNLVCPDDTDGTIDLQISGGTPNYSISWTGPGGFSSGDEDLSGLSQGVYVVEVIDANGCTASSAAEILALDTMVVSATVSPISCAGGNDGAIDIDLTGGTPDYVFSWTGPDGFVAATADITGLAVGTYTLTITDANNCTTGLTVELAEVPPLELSADLTDLTCDGILDGAIDLTVSGGTSPYSYQWSGPAGFTADVEDIAGLNTGNYTVLVTDSLGCTANASFTVGAGEAVLIEGEVTDASCDTNDDGSITATVSGGNPPYSIIWIGPDGFTASTLTITDLPAGTYTLFATDQDDCFAEASFTVNNPTSIDIAGDVTDLLCAGESNGAIDITLTGVAGPITIAWSGPDSFVSNDEDISALESGDYTISVVDSLGCLTEAVFTIDEPQPLDLSLLVTQPSCDEPNGEIIATVSGGTVSDDYTYLWTDGENNIIGSTNQVNGLGAGTYTITVADDNGCSVSQTVELSETDIEIDAVVTNLNCNGDGDGAIETDISGGAPPYVLEWSGPDGFVSDQEDIFGLSGGTYVLTVTDSINCAVVESFTVIEPDALNVQLDATDITCAGDDDGSIAVEVTGGTPPYTFDWSGPGGFASNDTALTGLSAGTYFLSLIDANGCASGGSVAIAEPDPITVDATITPIVCAGQPEGAIDLAISGGTPSYTLSWTGPDGFVSDQPSISGLLTGDYLLELTDANGCAFVDAYNVPEENPIVLDAEVTPVTCAGIDDGAIDLTVSGGTPDYAYAWTGPDGFTADTEDITGLAAGSYDVVVTDSLGCSATVSFDIVDPSPIQLDFDVVNPLCNGDANGTILTTITGGTTPYTFLWTGPDAFVSDQANISDLTAGTYALQVTDSAGCIANASVDLEEPTALDITAEITPIICNGDSTGSISVTVAGGTPSYTLSWSGPDGFSSNDPGLVNLVGGTYTLELTDANFCALDTSFTLSDPPPFAFTATVSGISCNGEDDGAIAVAPQGGVPPYTFAWDGPGGFADSTSAIDSLSAGTYTLTLTDSIGCAIDTAFTVIEPALLNLALEVTQPECLQSNGALVAIVAGGTPPYSYEWLDGDNNPIGSDSVLTGLSAGIYTVNVTDVNGCTATETIPLSDLGGEIEADITNVSCFGGSDGAIATTVLNAIPPLDYAWSTSDGFNATTPDISNLTANAYTLVVTDSAGCVYIDVFDVTQPDSIALAATVSGISCFGGDGAVSLSVTGGTPPYAFAWSGPNGFADDTAQIDSLLAGDYTVVVTDSLGCLAELTVNVTELDPIVIGFDAADISCNGFDDGAIGAIVSGGQTPYTLVWVGPNSFTADTPTISDLAPGFYEVQVTDANGCTATNGVLIAEPAPLTVSVSTTNSTCGNNDGAAVASASGGTGDFGFNWLDGAGNSVGSGPSIGGLAPGIYTLQVTDENDCLAEEVFTISDDNGDIDAVVTPPSCANGDDGAIALTVSGGTEPYSFAWTGPNGFASDQQNISGLLPGLYFVQVTDGAGCVFVAEFLLEIPESLTLTFDVQQISCNGANDGSILVTVDGAVPPIDIEWVGPDGFNSTGAFVENLSPGTYIVLVTDSALCAATDSVTVTEPSPIAADIAITDNLCADDTSGSLTISVVGGTPPFTFQWIGPNGFESTGQNLGGLATGFYEVQVTDSLGCTALFSAEVGSTPAIEVDLDINAPQCFGDANGSIAAVVSGGTAPFLYDWTGPDGFTADTPSIDDLAAGSYTLTVTDSNACALAIDTLLTQPDSLQATLSVSQVSCNGFNDGSLSVAVSGGTAPYAYDWSGPNEFADTLANITDLAPGVYNLTYTDSLGCSAQLSATITEPDSLVAVLDLVSDALCSADNSGAIDVSVSGGTTPYSFAWLGPNDFTADDEDLVDLFPGDYQLAVTDSNGCAAALDVSVGFVFEVVADAGLDTALCADLQPLVLEGVALNADSTWWTDASGEVLTSADTLVVDAPPGTYTYFYNVSNGPCADIDSVVVTVFDLPVADAGPDQSIVEGDEVVLGGNPSGPEESTYLWSPNLTLSDSAAANPTAMPETTTAYILSVVDANGCFDTDTTLVTVFPDIDVPTGISPNGDGFNDDWIIEHIEQFPGNVVEVYNRWGDLLERIEGYDNNEPWDGFFNGKLLPVGTYYYIIELNDPRFPEPYTGPITIFR